MPPDVSGFEQFAILRALGDRLRTLGLNSESVGAVARIGGRTLDPLAGPMRRYHLRKRSDLLARAMRLFVFADRVSVEEASEVLGDVPFDRLLASGIVVREAGDDIRSPFLLNCIGALYVLCDDLAHGDDAVMGVSNTTADLCRAAGSSSVMERALDLGCGAGAAALTLAARCETVVATDINPRAIVFTRANALLNGIENIDARVGDMFAPVAGETFDLIVSQPPFVPQPAGAAAATYLYGGRRGDELPLRLLRELPPHLAEGGRAIVLVDWPMVDGDPIDLRVRKALGEHALSVLILSAPPSDLDEWASSHAFLEERSVDERFERRALLRRSHFDEMSIHALRLTFNVIVETAPPNVWTRSVEILPTSRALVHGGHIDALVATSSLLQASDAELLAAQLRLTPGAELVERAGRVRVVFRDLLPPIELSRGAAMLATAASSAPSVRHAIAEVSSRVGDGDMTAQMLAGVRQALALAVLQLA